MSICHYRSGTCATYSKQTAYRGKLTGRAAQKKMNQIPVIVGNPAYGEELELDEDGVNPANLIPLVSVILLLSLSQPRRTRM